MLKAILLSIFVVALPSVSAVVDPAVKFNVYGGNVGCTLGVGGDGYSYADDGCKPLPRDRLDVKYIADTCRGMDRIPGLNERSLMKGSVFIYRNRDCTGAERQVSTSIADDCIDIQYFHSMKVFCH
jgi:hypothetical protein